MVNRDFCWRSISIWNDHLHEMQQYMMIYHENRNTIQGFWPRKVIGKEKESRIWICNVDGDTKFLDVVPGQYIGPDFNIVRICHRDRCNASLRCCRRRGDAIIEHVYLRVHVL